MIEEETNEQKTVKTRFFCYLASLVSYDVRSYILFFRLHLDLVYYRIDKADRRKDRLSYLYSLLISLACSILLIMYVAGLIAQLIIHIQHQKERTLLPVWCMLTAVLMLVPLFEDFSILGSSWNFKGYFLSIVAYLAYLFTKLPKVIESYRYHATIRYAVWVALVLGIILSML